MTMANVKSKLSKCYPASGHAAKANVKTGAKNQSNPTPKFHMLYRTEPLREL